MRFQNNQQHRTRRIRALNKRKMEMKKFYTDLEEYLKDYPHNFVEFIAAPIFILFLIWILGCVAEILRSII